MRHRLLLSRLSPHAVPRSDEGEALWKWNYDGNEMFFDIDEEARNLLGADSASCASPAAAASDSVSSAIRSVSAPPNLGGGAEARLLAAHNKWTSDALCVSQRAHARERGHAWPPVCSHGCAGAARHIFLSPPPLSKFRQGELNGEGGAGMGLLSWWPEEA